MEEHAECVGSLVGVFHLHVDGLAGCKARDGTFLIVVVAPSVFERTVGVVFEEEGIDPVVVSHVARNGGGLTEIHHAHQRVVGGEAEYLVVSVDCVESEIG